MTNPFRRCEAASLRFQGEAWVERPGRPTCVDEMVRSGPTTWLGMGCSEGRTDKQRGLVGVCDLARSQSPHSTEVVWCTDHERMG
jgi:hypothetical protein